MIPEMEKQISPPSYLELKNTRGKKTKIQWGIVLTLCFLNLLIGSIVFRADRQGQLTVAFLDVGQGDAIFIEAPNGNQVLIDGGPSGGAVLRALSQVMPFWDRSIDLVLATHPDQDHIGGFPAVLQRMNVDNVLTTENTSTTGAYEAFENIMKEKQTHHILARAGERITLDQGVVLEILFPDRNTAGWETNTSSIVARLSYGNESFLFTGDLPQEVEKYVVGKEGALLHANVLKLGHHGSRTSSSRIFLSAVNPDYAVISAGKDNKYGHPHQEVIDLLSEFKIPTVSTIDHGTIIFKTNGEEINIE